MQEAIKTGTLLVRRVLLIDLMKLVAVGDIFSIFSVLKGIQTDLEQVFPALPKIIRQSPERLKKQLSSVQLAEEDESAY